MPFDVESGRGEEAQVRVWVCGVFRGVGRKRIVISRNLDPFSRFLDITILFLPRKRIRNLDPFSGDSPEATPLKRQYSGRIVPEAEKSDLEMLPQDVLVKVLCGVENEDLKQLCQVSRTVGEATLIAQKCHFEYTTPRKLRSFRTLFDSENQIDHRDAESPKAPLRSSKERICRTAIAEVSTILFDSDDEDEWQNGRSLFAGYSS